LDANNSCGVGFSILRYYAETIFPLFDPSVWTVIAKEVHGDVWKFRHIYKGTSRQHLSMIVL